MCTVCGCSAGETHIEGHSHDRRLGPVSQPNFAPGAISGLTPAPHPPKQSAAIDTHSNHIQSIDVQSNAVQVQQDHHHYGLGPAHAHAPGLSQSRMVQIEQDILAKNNDYADANRRWLNERGILALNLVSSPGSGKTSLLTRTIEDLANGVSISVIEGDQQTANDADRIRQTGVKAIQINTGKGCHLDGHMVGQALQSLQPDARSIVFIENVGNLVCPAAFDLGEAHKVVILSVTEGEDKPLKYPDMFYAADLMLLNKTDLLPYLDFDVQKCIDLARRVNPEIKILQVSAKTGDGLDTWYQWLTASLQLNAIGR